MRWYARSVVVAFAFVALASCASETIDEPISTTTTTEPSNVARGRDMFLGTCASCHGRLGLGVEGLGGPVVGSAYLAGLDDTEAVNFLSQGWPASVHGSEIQVDMPPRGGNPDLGDDDLRDIVSYLRTLE